MKELNTTQKTGGSLVLFDERGTLIGTIERPLRRDPVGPGRESVYLARPSEGEKHPAAAA